MSRGWGAIPFISPYMAATVVLKETDLPYFCLFGGLATVFSLPYIGQVADRHGKRQIFTLIGLISIAPPLITSNLPAVRVAIGASVIIMEFVSGRFVPTMALVISRENILGQR